MPDRPTPDRPVQGRAGYSDPDPDRYPDPDRFPDPDSGRSGAAADLDGYLRGWSHLHGGVAPVGLIRFWVLLVRALALPPARLGLPPDLITAVAVLLVLPAAAAARAGGRWLLAAALLIAVSGVLDGVDGAVALLRGRAGGWGAVLDSVADRVAEAGCGAALWLAGAPGWLAVVAVASGWLHEYLRARAGVAGMSEIGLVTVGERPTRLIVAVMFLLAGGLFPGAGQGWASAGAAVWAAAGLAGLAQLLVVVRARLRAGDRGDDRPRGS